MGKIRFATNGMFIYLSYNDYPEKRQLKDFYKIYKKASGYTVKEYHEENETITALTQNETSVLVGYDPANGCFIRSDKRDIHELIGNAFEMLCYRYSGYSEYRELFEKQGNGNVDELSERAGKKHEEISDDEEVFEDIKELLHMMGIA